MPKTITRKTLKLFGKDGPTANFAQAGSQRAGLPVFTKDIATIQGLTAFLNGLQDMINDANKAPFLEDINAILYLVFYKLAYADQEGIPEWDPGTTYFQYSIVKKPGTFELYGSLLDDNLNQVLPSQTDNSFWKYVSVGAQPTVSVIFYPMPGAIPVTHLECNGAFVSQATYSGLFAKAGHFFNGGVDPGDGTFKLPDYRGLTLFGQSTAGTFSVIGSTGGRETHIHTVPAHNHTTPNHRHNIQGQNIGGDLGAPQAIGWQRDGIFGNAILALNGGGYGNWDQMQHFTEISGGDVTSTQAAVDLDTQSHVNPFAVGRWIIKT